MRLASMNLGGIALFVANIRGSAGAIEREHLELPFDWYRSGQVARGFVASLIFEFSVDRENGAILRKRAAQPCGADSYVLADAEGALEDGHGLFDCGQVKDFGRGINEWFELQARNRIEDERGGPVTFGALRVYVHIGRETHFHDERDVGARNAAAVGLFEIELEVRSLKSLRYFLPQFREEFSEEAVSSEPVAIFWIEKFFANDAVGVYEKVSRTRKTLLHAGSFLIQHAISLDDYGVRVSEQGVGDLMPGGKKFEDFFAVIADGRQLDALLFESRDCVLQLDQLLFAKWSPIGGTEEEEDGAAGALQSVERLEDARLVAQRKKRGFLTNGKPDRH